MGLITCLFEALSKLRIIFWSSGRSRGDLSTVIRTWIIKQISNLHINPANFIKYSDPKHKQKWHVDSFLSGFKFDPSPQQIFPRSNKQKLPLFNELVHLQLLDCHHWETSVKVIRTDKVICWHNQNSNLVGEGWGKCYSNVAGSSQYFVKTLQEIW